MMQRILSKNMWIKICSTVFIALTQISWIGMSDGEAALANFTKKFNKEISQEYKLHLFGSGASFPVKIEDIMLRFQADYCSDVVSGRKLAVEIAHKMIKMMNQDDRLLKYLSSNPATVKHVDLIISFKNQKTTGSLDSIMIIGLRNKVIYNTRDENDNLIDLHKETFEEAERIARQ